MDDLVILGQHLVDGVDFGAADVLARRRWRDRDALLLQAFSQAPDEAVRAGRIAVRRTIRRWIAS